MGAMREAAAAQEFIEEHGEPQDWAIEVSEHAMWQAAIRFPRFDTVLIEQEVRDALRARRVSAQRAHLGLHPSADPRTLYAWTEDGQRIYALRAETHPPCFVVVTTMRADSWRRP